MGHGAFLKERELTPKIGQSRGRSGRVARWAERGRQEATCNGGKVGWVRSADEGGMCRSDCVNASLKSNVLLALRAGSVYMGPER